ncbi:histidine-specific methyltransferase EgtD [Acetobacter orientalis]|uniref:Histidine-specific methyltransferase EgtD n=1 Tax=Acetobacter orientalis TaxID=146474 RepID=A0A2Z5ZKN4_9PROT|nr:histidine-specific methyltransferase EgtD [Acetobacter orientalis]
MGLGSHAFLLGYTRQGSALYGSGRNIIVGSVFFENYRI